MPERKPKLKRCPFCGGRAVAGRYETGCVNELCAAMPLVIGRPTVFTLMRWNQRAPNRRKR